MNYVAWTVPDQAFKKGFTQNLNVLTVKCEETVEKRSQLVLFWNPSNQMMRTPSLGTSDLRRDDKTAHNTVGQRNQRQLGASQVAIGMKAPSRFTQRQNFHWLQWCSFIHVQKTIQQWHSHCSYAVGMKNQHIIKAISTVVAYGPRTEPLFGSMGASHAEQAQKTCTVCAWEGSYACSS